MLTDEGHVKIVDFGACKIFENPNEKSNTFFGICKIFENPNEKSNTFVGTAEYLAPEMILRSGHTKNVGI